MRVQAEHTLTMMGKYIFPSVFTYRYRVVAPIRPAERRRNGRVWRSPADIPDLCQWHRNGLVPAMRPPIVFVGHCRRTACIVVEHMEKIQFFKIQPI